MNFENLPLQSTRDGFGTGLVQVAQYDWRIVALSADLGDSTRAIGLKELDPNRYFEVGIAEQNMVGLAAGFALAGMVPFATSFGTFLQRGWEQIRISVAYNNINVKLVGTHCGLQTGSDGATAQMLEDIALMRVLPNMTVVVPADAEEARKATLGLAYRLGPCYLRLGRELLPVWTQKEDRFVFGRANVVREGGDVTIIACGAMVYESLVAADMLSGEGLQVRVLNMHTIKPLDEEAIRMAAVETGAIVTAEEHQLMGGLGSAVAETVGRICPVPLGMVGVKDRFGESGTASELFDAFGLTSQVIAREVREVALRKNSVSS